MKIDSSRFGAVDVNPQRLITLEGGLFGYGEREVFALLESDIDGHFFWLQSAEDARLAFVVAIPGLFVPAYRPPARRDELLDLGLARIDDAQLLVIVNKHGEALTGNLKGPIVINPKRRIGRQIIVADPRYSARHVLVRLDEASPSTRATVTPPSKEAALV